MRPGNEASTEKCGQPRRYKLALLTFTGLLAPVYFVPPALSAVLTGPRLVTVSAAVATIVVLMTYVIMPVLKYFTASWLCEQTSRNSQDFAEAVASNAKVWKRQTWTTSREHPSSN